MQRFVLAGMTFALVALTLGLVWTWGEAHPQAQEAGDRNDQAELARDAKEAGEPADLFLPYPFVAGKFFSSQPLKHDAAGVAMQLAEIENLLQVPENKLPELQRVLEVQGDWVLIGDWDWFKLRASSQRWVHESNVGDVYMPTLQQRQWVGRLLERFLSELDPARLNPFDALMIQVANKRAMYLGTEARERLFAHLSELSKQHERYTERARRYANYKKVDRIDAEVAKQASENAGKALDAIYRKLEGLRSEQAALRKPEARNLKQRSELDLLELIAETIVEHYGDS